MDGLHELTAAEATVTIAGQHYRLAPLRLRDWGEIERRILDTRPDPLDLVLTRIDGLPEPVQRELLAHAYDDARRGRRVSADELRAWLATPEGQIVQFWLSLRQHHPELSLDDAERLILLAGAENQFDPRNTHASDESLLGNSGGQVRPAINGPPSPGATFFAG